MTLQKTLQALEGERLDTPNLATCTDEEDKITTTFEDARNDIVDYINHQKFVRPTYSVMRNSGEVNNNDKNFPGIQFGKIDYSWMFLIKRREIIM